MISKCEMVEEADDTKRRVRNKDCHEFDALDEINIEKIKPYVHRTLKDFVVCSNFCTF